MKRIFLILVVAIFAMLSAQYAGAITVNPFWMWQQSVNEAIASGTITAAQGAAFLDPTGRLGSATQNFEMQTASCSWLIAGGQTATPKIRIARYVGNQANGKQTAIGAPGTTKFLYTGEIPSRDKIIGSSVLLSSSTTGVSWGPNITWIGTGYLWYYFFDSNELVIYLDPGAANVDKYDIEALVFYVE